MLHEKQGTRAQNWLLQKLSMFLKIFTYSGSPTSYLSGSLNFVSIRPKLMNLWASRQRVLKNFIWAQKGSFANSFANSNKQGHLSTLWVPWDNLKNPKSTLGKRVFPDGDSQSVPKLRHLLFFYTTWKYLSATVGCKVYSQHQILGTQKILGKY